MNRLPPWPDADLDHGRLATPSGCRAAAALLQATLVAALLGGAAFAAGLPPQDSRSDGVTVAVTPVNVEASAGTWSFKVSLSTQGQELNDDLVRTSHLINRAAGKNVVPTAWTGDAPGGRQRQGVLSFKAIKPLPGAIELRIQRIGEKAPRVFRWDLDCPCNDPKMHPDRAAAPAARPT